MRLLSTPPRVGDTVLWRYRRGVIEATVVALDGEETSIQLEGGSLVIVRSWRTLGEPEVAA